MKKKIFCIMLALYMLTASLCFDYKCAYATGLGAVAGWESALAGGVATLTLPFGQVAFLLFSLFGVTIAVNDKESIADAGQEMWNDFTNWYEAVYVPAATSVESKRDELMEDFMNWEEKAENGIFSKLSSVWSALGEFASYVKSLASGSVAINKNVVWKGDNAFISADSVIQLAGPIQNICTDSNSFYTYRNHCIQILHTNCWNSQYYWQGAPLQNKVAMVYEKTVLSNGAVRFDYYFISKEEFYIEWKSLDYHNNTCSNRYTYLTKKNGLYFKSYWETVLPAINKDITGLSLLDIPCLGVHTMSYLDYNSKVNSLSDEYFNNDVVSRFVSGLNENDKETTVPGALERDWSITAGSIDKAGVEESDEAIVLTGDAVRGRTSDSEKEVEQTFEDSISSALDATDTKEQEAIWEQVYEQSGVAGMTSDEAEKEVSKQTPSLNNSEYQVNGLEEVFPFCIPFDIYKFVTCFSVKAKAPHFVYSFKYLDRTYKIDLDLSQFDSVAELFRLMQLILFIIALAVITRSHFLRS